MVFQDVPDGEDPPVALGSLAQVVRFFDGERHRLLDQDVLAGVEELGRKTRVRGCRRRENDSGDVPVVEDISDRRGHACVGIADLQGFETDRVAVAYRSKSAHLAEDPSVVNAPGACSNDGYVRV